MSEKNKSGLPLSLLICLITSLVVAFVMMLVGSLLISSGILPDSMIDVFPSVAGLFSAFLCGRGAARLLGARALLTGSVTGVAYFFVLFFLGAVFFLRWSPGASTISMLLCCLVGGVLGGLLSASRKRRTRAPHIKR